MLPPLSATTVCSDVWPFNSRTVKAGKSKTKVVGAAVEVIGTQSPISNAERNDLNMCFDPCSARYVLPDGTVLAPIQCRMSLIRSCEKPVCDEAPQPSIVRPAA